VVIGKSSDLLNGCGAAIGHRENRRQHSGTWLVAVTPEGYLNCEDHRAAQMMREAPADNHLCDVITGWTLAANSGSANVNIIECVQPTNAVEGPHTQLSDLRHLSDHARSRTALISPAPRIDSLTQPKVTKRRETAADSAAALFATENGVLRWQLSSASRRVDRRTHRCLPSWPLVDVRASLPLASGGVRLACR
jgi:hypothetical protein